MLRVFTRLRSAIDVSKNPLRPDGVPGEINLRPKYIFLRPGDVGTPLVSSPDVYIDM